MSDSSENSISTSDPPTPPPKRQKASTSTGKHKGARTHKGKEGEGMKGLGKKRREPSPSSASSGSDPNSPDDQYEKQKNSSKKVKLSHKPSPIDDSSHLCIFRRHYSDLVLAISSCLNTVANKLYFRNIISDEILNVVLEGRETSQNTASKLLLYVKRSIDLNPAVMFEFIDVVKGELSCEMITKKIKCESECT